MHSFKIKKLPEILSILNRLRRERKKIVTTNGCFDMLHGGHLQSLSWAKAQGDILVVGINSDASVRKLKGPLRPILPAQERAFLVAAFSLVDYVFIFNSKRPMGWLQKIKPNYHVKGRSNTAEALFIPEKEVVEKNGGKVLLAPILKGRSTTNVIETILDRYQKPEKSKPQKSRTKRAK